MNALMCSSYNKKPCDGGGAAFSKISDMGGAVSERCVPYYLLKSGKPDWKFCFNGVCPNKCMDNTNKIYWKVGQTKYLGKEPKDVKEEIYQNGPVAVAFPVYWDSYKRSK